MPQYFRPGRTGGTPIADHSFAGEFAVTGGFPRGLFFYLMLLPGVLFLLSAFLRPERKGGPSR
jgi:hypothetical protein